MAIYDTPLSRVQFSDLEALLQEGAVENIRLEFKLKIPEKEGTLKKLSSFANTFGGFMVIGAAADKDGRIKGLPGVDVELGYKQKIVDWCYSAVSPPFYVEVSEPIPVSEGKVCYVIYTAESEATPHFLNGRRGVWVRTDEFLKRFDAQLATEVELRQLFDRRKLIRERRASLILRARSRFDCYAANLQTGLSGIRNKPEPLLEFCVVPRFPARPLCAQEELEKAIQASSTYRRGGMFTAQSAPTISQHESVLVLEAAKPLTSIFEVNVWGVLFYGIYMKRTDENPEVSGININRFIGSILMFILHADKMFQALGYSGHILIDVKLRSILGVKWVQAWEGYAQAVGGSELDDELHFEIFSTTDDLQKRSDGVLIEILRQVFFAVNLSAYTSTPQNTEALAKKGYEFNGWPKP